jgi:hypothetical protein
MRKASKKQIVIPGADSSAILKVSRAQGQSLDGDIREFAESRFAYDFSRNRVHSDTLSRPTSSSPVQQRQKEPCRKASGTVPKLADIRPLPRDVNAGEHRDAQRDVEPPVRGAIVRAEPLPIDRSRMPLHDPGVSLPHLDAIQRSFGAHDLSGVRAHTGSAATAAARRLGAQAFTFGNHVVFSGTPSLHTAAHEAAHAVGTSSERQADTVADQVVRGQSSAQLLQAAPQVRPPADVIQLKKVPTGYGDFETTTFKNMDDGKRRGVDIDLAFEPDEKVVNAKAIALTQSIRTTSFTGTFLPLGPNPAGRTVPAGKPGEGYAVDASGSTNNPLYYDTKNLGPKEELKDTPVTNPTVDPTDPTKVLVKANYQIGHCFKEKPTDTTFKKQSATLADKPRTGRVGESQTFETTALAIDGKDKNNYYGSVRWGYKITGTTAAPVIESDDIELASSKGKPSDNFLEAAKLWNAGSSLGKLQTKSAVRAQKADGSGFVELTKGTPLRQIAALTFSGVTPGTQAEVLNADGTGTGTIVAVKNSDIEDAGGGTKNKPLPL